MRFLLEIIVPCQDLSDNDQYTTVQKWNAKWKNIFKTFLRVTC